jgi:hypothetical protein
MWYTGPALRTPPRSNLHRRNVLATCLLAWLICLGLSLPVHAAERLESRSNFSHSVLPIPAPHVAWQAGLDPADGAVRLPDLAAALDDATDDREATCDDGTGDVLGAAVDALPPPCGVSRLPGSRVRVSILIHHDAPALRGPPVLQ